VADGMTCEPFRRLPPKIGGLTLCAEDFHAPTFQTQESGQESTENKADCGGSTSGSFAHYDLATSSWKTWQRCLTGELDEFSGTWPQAGTMRNGRCCQHAPLVLHIHARDCSLLPTPAATDGTVGSIVTENTKLIRKGRKIRVLRGSGDFGLSFPRFFALVIGMECEPEDSEEAMGFPIGWTALERSEMPSCPKLQPVLAGES